MDLDSLAVHLIRLVSGLLFAVGAWLCRRRRRDTGLTLWLVLGVVAALLAAYRLGTWALFSVVGGEAARDLAGWGVVAANVGYCLAGVALIYAVAQDVYDERRERDDVT